MLFKKWDPYLVFVLGLARNAERARAVTIQVG